MSHYRRVVTQVNNIHLVHWMLKKINKSMQKFVKSKARLLSYEKHT